MVDVAVDAPTNHTTAHDIKMNMTRLLNGLEEETRKFVTEEMKKNVVTGGTPTPKERSYPRTLLATSPHQKIVKRFLHEQSLSKRAVKLPLDDRGDDSVISASTT